MSMASPEHEFVSKFLTLATLSQPPLPYDYKKPLPQVNNLGVALPALKYRYDPRRASGTITGENIVKLTLKSVRPPKFVLDHEFGCNHTVHQIKEYLVSESKAQQVNQLKLLFKGKVLHDSELLSSLNANAAAITVMISKPAAQDMPTPEQKDEPVTQSPLQLPWEAIGGILASELKDSQQAASAMARLQRGWELTK